LKELGEFGLG